MERANHSDVSSSERNVVVEQDGKPVILDNSSESIDMLNPTIDHNSLVDELGKEQRNVAENENDCDVVDENDTFSVVYKTDNMATIMQVDKQKILEQDLKNSTKTKRGHPSYSVDSSVKKAKEMLRDVIDNDKLHVSENVSQNEIITKLAEKLVQGIGDYSPCIIPHMTARASTSDSQPSTSKHGHLESIKTVKNVSSHEKNQVELMKKNLYNITYQKLCPSTNAPAMQHNKLNSTKASSQRKDPQVSGEIVKTKSKKITQQKQINSNKRVENKNQYERHPIIQNTITTKKNAGSKRKVKEINRSIENKSLLMKNYRQIKRKHDKYVTETAYGSGVSRIIKHSKTSEIYLKPNRVVEFYNIIYGNDEECACIKMGNILYFSLMDLKIYNLHVESAQKSHSETSKVEEWTRALNNYTNTLAQRRKQFQQFFSKLYSKIFYKNAILKKFKVYRKTLLLMWFIKIYTWVNDRAPEWCESVDNVRIFLLLGLLSKAGHKFPYAYKIFNIDGEGFEKELNSVLPILEDCLTQMVISDQVNTDQRQSVNYSAESPKVLTAHDQKESYSSTCQNTKDIGGNSIPIDRAQVYETFNDSMNTKPSQVIHSRNNPHSCSNYQNQVGNHIPPRGLKTPSPNIMTHNDCLECQMA